MTASDLVADKLTGPMSEFLCAKSKSPEPDDLDLTFQKINLTETKIA